MGKSHFSTETKKQLQKMAAKQAQKYAVEARERLTNEYLFCIRTIYQEYQPKFYYRHWNGYSEYPDLINSGLGHTFNKYYRNHWEREFTGGIIISPLKMFSDYQSAPSVVLDSFYSSDGNTYHGPAFMHIQSSLSVYNHMHDFYKSLINEFKERLK